MENRVKYLIKNTAIFTIGNIATKLISFFLIPLYTNVLTTSEYGVVDLVITISTIAVPLLTLNVMEAVMRFNWYYHFYYGLYDWCILDSGL